MSLKFVLSRLLLPAVALGLAITPLQARFVNLQDLPKTIAFKDAIEKLKNDPKDKDAVAALKKAADSGDKEGQFAYAFALQNALGGMEAPKDKPDALTDQAKALYKKAADAGHANSLNNLALLRIATGEEAEAAVKTIQKAADDGGSRARITLAEMHLEGIGVAKDPEAALRWLDRVQDSNKNEALFLTARVNEAMKDHESAIANLMKAADDGYIQAMIYLGNKILNLQNGNIEKAREYFEKAIKAGEPAATIHLGVLAEAEGAAEERKKDGSKEKANSHYQKALEHFKAAADLKVGEAYNKLGYFHEKGLGVTKADEAEAFKWYKLGAEAGMPISLYNIAVLNEEGRGVKTKDAAEAIKYYFLAARAGLAEAQLALAERYRSGKSVLDKDPIVAMAWMEKAAKGGSMAGQLQLAYMLESNEAGVTNYKAAAELYLDAAKKGNPIGMFNLADMLQQGRGVQKDIVEAYAYLAISAKLTANDENFGKQAATKLSDLKKKMSLDEQRKGDERMNALLGTKPEPAPKAPPATTPTSPPKSTPKADPKAKNK